MKPESTELVKNLEQSLEGLIKIYRLLLNVVRKEKEILIATQLEELSQNNKTKEITLMKAREAEEARRKIAFQLAEIEGLDPKATRLLDLARHFGGETGDRFRKLHSVLELLMRRVREHNQYNESLVQSALNTITGAMDNLRDNITGTKTYKKSGTVKNDPAESGQLVRKQV
jgi:hypothetical protein